MNVENQMKHGGIKFIELYVTNATTLVTSQGIVGCRFTLTCHNLEEQQSNVTIAVMMDTLRDIAKMIDPPIQEDHLKKQRKSIIKFYKSTRRSSITYL